MSNDIFLFIKSISLILCCALGGTTCTDEPQNIVRNNSGLNPTKNSFLPSKKNSVPVKTQPDTNRASSNGKECHLHRGKISCEGPQQVPLSSEETEKKTLKLDLDPLKTGQWLQNKSPKLRWVKAVGNSSDTTFLWPVKNGKIWRKFGLNVLKHRTYFHSGIDIGGRVGTKIHAVNRGLVAYSDNRISGYGNMVMIVHADHTVTSYAHCHVNHVDLGQIVERGEIIAEVGKTGIAYGPHLHFELRQKGKVIDPLPRFDKRDALLHKSQSPRTAPLTQLSHPTM